MRQHLGQTLRNPYLWNHWMDLYISSSMELSWAVVVQHHGFDLDLGFSRSKKMLYLRIGRADWHGTKGMWIDRMLHPLCDCQHSPHPWPWPWIFKVKFLKKSYSGMGCRLTEPVLHPLCDCQHSPHPWPWPWSRSNFWKRYLRNGMADWHGERDVSR